MRAFTYHRPTTVPAAVALLAGLDDAMPLAGGLALIPAMKQGECQPSDLVDLAGVPGLIGIAAADDGVTIGAMTTHDAVARSVAVARLVPGLADLCARIGDAEVRNRATLGGSLADNGKAYDYPAAVLALGATIFTDRRTITADDFFTGPGETALTADELIVRVHFPAAACSYAKVERRSSRAPVAGVFVARTAHGPRVAVVGAAAAVFRLPGLEADLARAFSPAAAIAAHVPVAILLHDIHAGADYRAHLVRVMAKRAIARLV